jgi:hypothetical protein
VIGPCISDDVAQAAEQERKAQFGNRLGVHTLAARPRAPIVEDGHEVLDAGERQLHPLELRRASEPLAQPGRIVRRTPDETARVLDTHDIGTSRTRRIA